MKSSTSTSKEALIRCLVVEDERPAREYLVELLHGTGLVQVIAAVATEKEARDTLGAGGVAVDAAFIDINLASSTSKNAGLEIVRDFASQQNAPVFVLATAFKQHALEAFELDVTDYLLKPFTEERVRECLSRIARRIPPAAPNAPSRVVARNRKGLVFLNPDDVWAFEASDRLTFVHSVAGRFDIDLSLTAMESAIGNAGLRVHRNWIVSTPHILAMEKDELGWILLVGPNPRKMDQSIRIPVAREKVQRVREYLLTGTTGLRR